MRCISILPDFFDFVDDPFRRVGHGQRRDVAGEQRPPCGVGEQFARRLHGPCGRFGVGDQNGSLPVDERLRVLGLVIFGQMCIRDS